MTVHTLSNSSWNLDDLLEDFLDVHQIPRGPLLLRDWSLRTLKSGERHKLVAIQALLDTYPDLELAHDHRRVARTSHEALLGGGYSA